MVICPTLGGGDITIFYLYDDFGDAEGIQRCGQQVNLADSLLHQYPNCQEGCNGFFCLGPCDDAAEVTLTYF